MERDTGLIAAAQNVLQMWSDHTQPIQLFERNFQESLDLLYRVLKERDAVDNVPDPKAQ